MLGQWCAAGQHYPLFWELTFREICTILDGDQKRRVREHDDARARNYELAVLVSFAHHDPGKMPAFKASGADEKAKSDELAQAQVRGFFIAAAMSAKKK